MRSLITRYAEWKTYKQSVKAENKLLYYVLEAVETIVIVLPTALLIKAFIVQSSLVFSGSMIPTMGIGDRLIVNKLSFYYKAPVRGDIIVFESPTGDGREFVKRLVGLPNETIEVNRGIIYINDKPITFKGIRILRDYSHFGPVKIPEGQYFFMGDNRANSSDSRYWGFVPEDELIGTAVLTYWPVSNIQLIR